MNDESLASEMESFQGHVDNSSEIVPDSGLTENSSVDQQKLNLSHNMETKLIDHIMKNWEESDAARTKWKQDKEEGLQLYWGLRKGKNFPFPNCANLHVPLIRTIADSLHANLMGSIADKKPVSVLPVGPEDLPKARKAERLLNWQFTTQVDYADMVDKIIQSNMMYGMGVAKVRYVLEKEGEEIKYDGLKIDILPVERLLMPSDASDDIVDEWDFVIQEIPASKSDIKKRQLSGMYDKSFDIKRLPSEGGEKSLVGSKDLLQSIRDIYTGTSSTFKDTTKNYHTILEWYGNYDWNEDDVDESILVTVLLEQKKILRAVSWKGPRPFKVIRFSPILNKAVGESIPDLIGRINQELNILHNQRVDAVTLQNIPFFFFDPASGFNPSNVHLTPGLGIPINGSPTQAVYFPSMNITRPEMYREEEILNTMAERMLGAGANIQGVRQGNDITATEIATIDRRAGIRFLTIFNRIKKGLTGIFNLALYLDQENLKPEIQVRIVGLDMSAPLFETVSKEEILGRFDIIVNGNSIVDEQAEKQEQVQLYNLGMMNPLITSDSNALYELTKDTFVKLGASRIDSYLRRPENSIPKSPIEEHNLFLSEEAVKPNINENVEQHIQEHSDFINSPNFKLLSNKGKQLAMMHLSDTLRMKQVIDQLKKINQIQQINMALMQTHQANMLPQVPPNGGPNAGP